MMDELKEKEIYNAIKDMLVKSGYIGDETIEGEAAREARKKNNMRVYHNTELLLKKYRDILWMLECFPDTVANDLDVPLGSLDSIIESLDIELTYGNKRLEGRFESIKKTRLLLDRINEALTVLKKKPREGERLYELIYLTYISAEDLTVLEICERLNMSSRTYYRERKRAIEVISLRLWSSLSREWDLWLELGMLLEGD